MRLHHIAVESTNISASLHFYTQVLGFSAARQIVFQGSCIWLLQLGHCTLELLPVMQATAAPGEQHVCFEVDSLPEILVRLEQYGYTAAEGPYALSNGWQTVFIHGPGGESIEFLQVQ